MAKKQTITDLEQQRAALVEKVKRLDSAIKIARETERAEKSKKLLAALAERGLLDADPAELLARIDGAASTKPAGAPGSVSAKSAENLPL